jgi:hypothetical protein
MSEPLMERAPRIPRGEEVGIDAIVARLDWLNDALTRNGADLDVNQREYAGLIERNHELVDEHERLRIKLSLLIGAVQA